MTDTQQQEYKATAEQWAKVEEKQEWDYWAATALELRSRVEDLEKHLDKAILGAAGDLRAYAEGQDERWQKHEKSGHVLRLTNPESVPTAAAETTEPSSADASTWTWVTTKVFFENGAMMRTQVRVT